MRVDSVNTAIDNVDEVILQLKQVGLQRKDFALEDISFQIKAGYITILTGNNGAGKSTLLSILMGVNRKYTGKVELYGEDLKSHDRKNLEKIGYISEEPTFFMECDAIENEMFLSPHYRNWDKKLYREKLKELEVPVSTPLKLLSRGNYIKFQLTWAMAHCAELYVLDEPTAGLDPVYKKIFYRQLQELVAQGAGILMATNLAEDVEQIADYRMVM